MATEDPQYTIPVYPENPDAVRMMVTDSKLGGYIVGGDENTAAPALWKYLYTVEGVRSVIDIGCGEGHMLSYMRDLGCEVLGIDAIEQPDGDIVQHNYRIYPFTRDMVAFTMGVPGDRSEWLADLAWSCEFVEHVDEKHVPNFMETFTAAKLALITHATPGQPGWNHVNCQPAEYWIDVFEQWGFEYDEALTLQTRQVAAAEKWSYYVATGLAFRRRS